MSKRMAANCVKNVTKKVHRQDLADALEALKQGHLNNPDFKCEIAKAVVEASPDSGRGSKPDQGDQPGDVAPWDKTYKTFRRFPRSLMEKMLLEQSSGGKVYLSAARIMLWKILDKDIVLHLFEFDFIMDSRSQWPPGECHVKGIPEQVLAEWQRAKGGSQIARAKLGDKDSGCDREPNWSEKGVYGVLPEDTDKKTDIVYRPSGKIVPLPASLPVDSTWRFVKNWSGNESELVDATGYGRRCRTIFKENIISEVDWVDFATAEAQRLCPSYHAKPNRFLSRLNSAASDATMLQDERAPNDELEYGWQQEEITPVKQIKKRAISDDMTPPPEPPMGKP